MPKAYVLSRQPGTGKSSLMAKLKEEAHGNIVAINWDEFCKAHPNFTKLYEVYGEDYVKHTATFSGKMTEAMIEKMFCRRIQSGY